MKEELELVGYYRMVESENYGAPYKLIGIYRCISEEEAQRVRRKYLNDPNGFYKVFHDETELYPWAVYCWRRES